MKLSLTPRTAAERGFTLIELLVVITIIALLVTGAFGAYGFVMEKARKADAQAAATAVSNAVEQYYTEYDYLPKPTSATKGTDCESDTSATENLIPILLGMDLVENPRKQNFLGDIKEATNAGGRGDGTKKVGGLIRDGETAELVDPWGNFYKVTLDLDMDEKILNPNEEEAVGGTRELHKNVIVYSAGKDLDIKIWKDNVKSWASQ